MVETTAPPRGVSGKRLYDRKRLVDAVFDDILSGKMTQAEAAARAGVSQATMTRAIQEVKGMSVSAARWHQRIQAVDPSLRINVIAQ